MKIRKNESVEQGVAPYGAQGAPPVNADVGRRYMKKYLAIILLTTLPIITASAQNETKTSLPTQLSLSKLQAGMSSNEVEAIMGTPLKYFNAAVVGGDSNFLVAEYTCIITNVPNPGNHLITVHYRITEAGLRMTEVKGPHFPDENNAQQAGPGYPPQGVGSPDP